MIVDLRRGDSHRVRTNPSDTSSLSIYPTRIEVPAPPTYYSTLTACTPQQSRNRNLRKSSILSPSPLAPPLLSSFLTPFLTHYFPTSPSVLGGERNLNNRPKPLERRKEDKSEDLTGSPVPVLLPSLFSLYFRFNCRENQSSGATSFRPYQSLGFSIWIVSLGLRMPSPFSFSLLPTPPLRRFPHSQPSSCRRWRPFQRFDNLVAFRPKK